VSRYTEKERMQRMAMLMDSSSEVITEYMEMEIAKLHEQLEEARDPWDVRWLQGKIAGIRDFCMVVKN
jgi:hypothetical protein